MRRRLLGFAAAVIAAAGTVTFAATALPAQALNCAYGDNFYQFVSDLTGDFSANVTASPNGHNGQYLVDVSGGGTLFCQAQPLTVNGVSFSEWVQKGTANCLTFDQADLNVVRIQTCQQLNSQYWGLFTPLHGIEDWANIENYYYYGSADVALYDVGGSNTFDHADCQSFTIPPTGCPSEHDVHWDWSLAGPYR